MDFLIVANVPLHLGQAIDVVDGNNYIVMKRYGRVVTAKASDWSLGATREAANTGEIS